MAKTKIGCDCLNMCGDDPRLVNGVVQPCPMYVKKHSTRTVTVDKEGVHFGNCWISHEKITGESAETLNRGGRTIISQQYVKWLQQEVLP